MKRKLLGFALIFAVFPLVADWSFGNEPNSSSGFSFGNQPNSGSSFSFGNRPNSGSNFSFGDSFNFGDNNGFGFGNTPNYYSNWNRNPYGYGYRPYSGDRFHRNPVSGFSFGSHSLPYWNQGVNSQEIQAPAWMPPAYLNYYPVYISPPPSSMYYYPTAPAMVKAPEQQLEAIPATKLKQSASDLPKENQETEQKK